MPRTIAAEPDLIGAARALAPLVDEYRDESERERTLPKALVEALADADLFRIYVPKSLGGLEADPLTYMRVIEELARLDGAVGWNAMNWGANGLLGARLPSHAAREIYGDDPSVVVAASVAPMGKAQPVDGGYRLSGHWPLASGCLHAAWLVCGSMIFDGDEPRRNQQGGPVVRQMFVPRADCEIIDTWYSGGLRGTGSHDFAVHEVFVPEERTYSHPSGPQYEPGPLYRGPITDILGIGVSAVSLGIARAALDTFSELAGSKIPTRTAAVLRERMTVQAQLARAEALVRSARSLLFETAASTWESLCAGEPLSEEQTALKRLASVNTATSCAQAVDIVYTMGGATSVYTASRLERCFRDVHVVSQHMSVSTFLWERAGRYFLGLPSGER